MVFSLTYLQGKVCFCFDLPSDLINIKTGLLIILKYIFLSYSTVQSPIYCSYLIIILQHQQIPLLVLQTNYLKRHLLYSNQHHTWSYLISYSSLYSTFTKRLQFTTKWGPPDKLCRRRWKLCGLGVVSRKGSSAGLRTHGQITVERQGAPSAGAGHWTCSSSSGEGSGGVNGKVRNEWQP